MENLNIINARLAMGEKAGYFYSRYLEGTVYLGGRKGNLNETLMEPSKVGSPEYTKFQTLHGKIVGHLHSKVRELKGFLPYSTGDMSHFQEEDVDFLCEAYKTEILKKGSLEDNTVLLKPFEIILKLEVIDLKLNKVQNIKQVYEARNVKMGINVSFKDHLSIKYELIPKTYPYQS